LLNQPSGPWLTDTKLLKEGITEKRRKDEKNKIIIIVAASIVILFYTAYEFANLMAPGSYPYAERYELNIPDSELVKKIIRLKANNPELIVPVSTGLRDGKASNNDLWYHIYFYYPTENEILYTWVRSASPEKSILALVSVCEGTDIYSNKWKDINKDFTVTENIDQKTKFKERIINKLK